MGSSNLGRGLGDPRDVPSGKGPPGGHWVQLLALHRATPKSDPMSESIVRVLLEPSRLGVPGEPIPASVPPWVQNLSLSRASQRVWDCSTPPLRQLTVIKHLDIS